jgi:tetratricopeptide (TPR) repeat protein
MVENEARAMRSYDSELAKTRSDVAALKSITLRDSRDVEKRVRLAYRQFHLASLTEDESDYKIVKQTIEDVIRDFGPQEDICLLKANLNGRFHCLEEAKQNLAMCPLLAHRHAGRSIMADIDFQEGRYEQAGIALRALIDENRTWDALARLAHWKGKMGDPDEADRYYEEAEDELTAKEMNSFAWLELQRGALAQSRGRYGKARTHYQRASLSFPGHWRTDEHMAGLLAAEGNFAEAEALLQSVVDCAPKPELKQALGELLVFIGRTEEARPWLDAALMAFLASVQEGAVHYYHHLAHLYAGVLRQPTKAVQWARKDVALRSNFTTQSVLAWALFQNGEVAEGLEWIRIALSSGVQDSGIFATASSLFNASGDEAQGETYARAAAAINPSGHNFHLHH